MGLISKLPFHLIPFFFWGVLSVFQVSIYVVCDAKCACFLIFWGRQGVEGELNNSVFFGHHSILRWSLRALECSPPPPPQQSTVNLPLACKQIDWGGGDCSLFTCQLVHTRKWRTSSTHLRRISCEIWRQSKYFQEWHVTTGVNLIYCIRSEKTETSTMSVVGICIYIPSPLPDRKANPGFTNSPFKNIDPVVEWLFPPAVKSKSVLALIVGNYFCLIQK